MFDKSYLLQIAIGLVEGADQEGGCLYELLVLLLLLMRWKATTNVQSFIIRKNDPSKDKELLHQFFQKLSAFTSHYIISTKPTLLIL